MQKTFLSKKRFRKSKDKSNSSKPKNDNVEDDKTAAALAEALEDIKLLKQQLAAVQEAASWNERSSSEGRVETLASSPTADVDASRPERTDPSFHFSLTDSVAAALESRAGPKSIMRKKPRYAYGGSGTLRGSLGGSARTRDSLAVRDIMEGSFHKPSEGFDSPKQLAIRASTVRFVVEAEAATAGVSSIGGDDEPNDTVGDMIEGVVGRSALGRSVIKGTTILDLGLSYLTTPVSSSPDFGTRAITESMKENADAYRLSDTRPRVDGCSHYVARTGWGRLAERILAPVVPSSTERLVAFVFLFSMVQTVPFGVTRMRNEEGRYVHQFIQQYIFNRVVGVFGIPPPFGGDIDGLKYGTDAENPDRPGIDLAFAIHLVAGLLWIIFGSFQVLLTNHASRKFHRRFGYLSVSFFFFHAFGAMNNLWVDIVHHHPFVKVILFQDLALSMFYIIAGIISVKEGDLETHRDLMVRGFFTAIEGSGTIRFTTWIVWFVGKAFLGPELAPHYCKFACQSLSPTASAADCVVSYIFALQTMRLFSLYWNVLYLRTPEKVKDVTDRLRLSEEIYALFTFWLKTIVIIYAIYKLDDLVDWQGFRDLTSKGSWLPFIGMTLQTIMVAHMRFREVKSTLLMPRRDALSKSTVQNLASVQKWAASQGIDDSAKMDHAKVA